MGVGEKKKGRGAASMVAAGIMLSRMSGLARNWFFNRYFGLSASADAFNAAFKIPNFMQNLFGEGVLSASFIPVYARLRAEGRDEEATRLAEAVFGLLALCCSVLTAVGVLLTPWLIGLIAPGFTGGKRELTILLVRILFPGAALLAMSAWCLGILNSHRRFFLSYSVSVLWNLVMIAALLWKGPRTDSSELAIILSWASVVGSALQFAAQLPVVFRYLWPLRAHIGWDENVRTVASNFVPVFFARGVVQISAYVDTLLASFLPNGAVAALMNAQTIYTLPVSLFGMSISAAELPAMSAELGDEAEVAAALRARLERGLSRIAFFVVPSAAAFILLGDVVSATLFQSGRFSAADARYVWGVVAGSAVGLLASTSGRLYASAFYALRDTRRPRNFAVLRVVLTIALGWFFALPLPRLLGIEPRWGVAGLTLSAGMAGWVEFALLRRALQLRIGRIESSAWRLAKLWLAAFAAAGTAWAIKLSLPHLPPFVRGAAVLAPFAAVYIAVTWGMGLSELNGPINRLLRRK